MIFFLYRLLKKFRSLSFNITDILDTKKKKYLNYTCYLLYESKQMLTFCTSHCEKNATGKMFSDPNIRCPQCQPMKRKYFLAVYGTSNAIFCFHWAMKKKSNN